MRAGLALTSAEARARAAAGRRAGRARAQDLLVASLFRNFLLAERVMRAAHCTPASMPRLPASHQHPLWQARGPPHLVSTPAAGASWRRRTCHGVRSGAVELAHLAQTLPNARIYLSFIKQSHWQACGINTNTVEKLPLKAPMRPACVTVALHKICAQAWDMAAEMCLLQLPALLSGEPGADFQPSPFFAEQLTAFELWLAHGSVGKQPPEQLPIVLQVLRALAASSGRYVAGCWARRLACAHAGQQAVQGFARCQCC